MDPIMLSNLILTGVIVLGGTILLWWYIRKEGRAKFIKDLTDKLLEEGLADKINLSPTTIEEQLKELNKMLTESMRNMQNLVDDGIVKSSSDPGANTAELEDDKKLSLREKINRIDNNVQKLMNSTKS